MPTNGNNISNELLEESIEAYRKTGNQVAAAALLGLDQSQLSRHLDIAKKRFGADLDLTPYVRGTERGLPVIVHALPKKGRIDRYLFTCAQNYTKLHYPTWKNLKAMAAHHRAHIVVSTIRYNKGALGQDDNAKKRKNDAELNAEFPVEVRDYISNDRVRFESDKHKAALEYCGQLNIIPTARRPLSAMENFTGRRSSIIPHPTIALKSVGSLKHEGTKLLFTTGTITEMNYIQRKEGFRAEHYHSYGALLVEIDHEGSWWCRHVLQGIDGAMWDGDVCVKDGKVKTGQRVQAITWGDIHATNADVCVKHALWRKGGLLDKLRPYEQHLHDVLDFECRSHHRRRDPMEMYRLHKFKKESVDEELKGTAKFIKDYLIRPWCKTYVVNSNHDRHLDRWLLDVDPFRPPYADPINVDVHDELLTVWKKNVRYGADREPDPKDRFCLTEYALQSRGCPESVRFLRDDESHIVCKEYDGGIECGMHGDRGNNGSIGTPSGFAQMGRRVNIGDKHSAEIIDGIYVSGTSGPRDLFWNKGPNSWSQSLIVTYPNSTRAIFTIWKAQAQAE